VALAGVAPTVGVSKTASPPTGTATLAGVAPTVVASNHQTVAPLVGTVTLGGIAPTVGWSGIARPLVGPVDLVGLAPTISAGNSQTVLPGVGLVTLAGLAPVVVATANIAPAPDTGVVVLAGLAPPTVIATAHVWAFPPAGTMVLTGLRPLVLASVSTYGWHVVLVREGPRWDVGLSAEGPRWRVMLDDWAPGVTMSRYAPLDFPVHNDWTGMTMPITGIGTNGLTELYHGGLTALVTDESGSDTPLGSLSAACTEIGATGRYIISFPTGAIDDALGALEDGAVVYRVLLGTGIRIEDPVTIRTVRSSD
jgi:hypothetical protein